MADHPRRPRCPQGTGRREVTTEEACHSILGDQLAHAIISSMGVHWAVVASMAQATTDDEPRAIEALREYIKRRET